MYSDKNYYTLDRIYDLIDEWMKSNQLDQIEAYIANITYTININLYNELYKPSEQDLDNWIGVLTASLPVKTKIKNRPLLFELVGKFVEKDVLAGLE